MIPDAYRALIVRYWLALAIVFTAMLAWLLPGPAKALPKLHILDIGVVLVMFLGSLKLTPSRFKQAAAKPHYVLLCVLSAFGLAPIVSLVLADAFGLGSEPDRLAVLISSAQATTLTTGIVLTEVAGGNMALAMVMTVVNNFVTVFLTPLLFRVFGNTEIEVDHTAMGAEIALKIVLPVIVAQLIRRPFAGLVARHSQKMSIASQIIILIYIYAGVAAGIEQLTGKATVLPQVIGFALVLHLCLLGANTLIARITMGSALERTAFVLCASQKTLPAAILIWKGYFSALPLGPIVAVAYHLIQLVIDSIIAPGFKRLPLIRDREK
ncbi:MAG: bile acid:sodium symporter [Myxococcota bacterium]|nr:bile acid:sodium symporter [Myxococcota bacterium]